MTKLKWMNGEYIKAMGDDEFYEMALPYIKKTVTKDYDYKKLAAMAKTRIEIFPDIYELLDFFEEVPEYDSEMYVHKKMKTTKESSLEVLKELLPKFEALDDYSMIHYMLFLQIMLKKRAVRTDMQCGRFVLLCQVSR